MECCSWRSWMLQMNSAWVNSEACRLRHTRKSSVLFILQNNTSMPNLDRPRRHPCPEEARLTSAKPNLRAAGPTEPCTQPAWERDNSWGVQVFLLPYFGSCFALQFYYNQHHGRDLRRSVWTSARFLVLVGQLCRHDGYLKGCLPDEQGQGQK